MLPCRAMGFLLMLFWVVSDVHLDNVPPEDIDMIVEDSTVSPMGEITPPLVMRHKTEAIVVNNNEVIMIDDNNVNYISGKFITHLTRSQWGGCPGPLSQIPFLSTSCFSHLSLNLGFR